MTTRARVVLLISGLVAAGVLIFQPGIADKLTACMTTWAGRKTTASANSSSHVAREPSTIPILSKNAATHNSPSVPPWDILRRTAANKSNYAVQPASFKIPAWQEVLAQSSPKAREMFETGMRYLRSGGYMAARLAFQTLVRTCPEIKVQALACWAAGLAFYKEGGGANLLMAKEQLSNFLIFFPAEPGLEELVETARINVAVINVEMMDYARNEKERITAAKISEQALTQFLKEYPDSIEAPAAQAHLLRIQWYLDSAERK